MNFTKSFQNIGMDQIPAIQWMESDWFKEWEHLSFEDYHGQKCGYWYYDTVTKMYIFISEKL